jgi:hypothetical protein
VTSFVAAPAASAVLTEAEIARRTQGTDIVGLRVSDTERRLG